jgi:putative zinc finger/helix-turn-helix YgiT family protein
MKCFKCAKGKTMPAMAGMTSRVRGEEIPVRAEAMVCNRCGFHVMTDAQSDAYTIASADVYRARHGLLTTKELKEIRRRLGMSFRTFAKYLKVSEASPKRWESGLVQDQAMDELIRLKSDLVKARENVTRLEAHVSPVHSKFAELR